MLGRGRGNYLYTNRKWQMDMTNQEGSQELTSSNLWPLHQVNQVNMTTSVSRRLNILCIMFRIIGWKVKRAYKPSVYGTFRYCITLDDVVVERYNWWIRAHTWRSVRTTGRWFSPSTLVGSTNKTGRHDIPELLLKMTLDIYKPGSTLDLVPATYIS